MFEFVSGPLVWIAVAVLVVGSVYRIVNMVRLAKQDTVIMPYMKLDYSLRSIAHWVVPYGSRSMRINTLMTAVAFAFHICLLATPLLLAAHWEIWGIDFPTLPDWLADAMTVVVILGGFYFLQRRLLVPYVANVTSYADYALLFFVVLPYLTGFIAYHQWFNYQVVITLHALSGCIMLMIIPFTRIAHMIYFAFTRAYMACEFGFVRHARDW